MRKKKDILTINLNPDLNWSERIILKDGSQFGN